MNGQFSRFSRSLFSKMQFMHKDETIILLMPETISKIMLYTFKCQ